MRACVPDGSLWRLHLALHLILLVIVLPLVQFALLLRRKLRLSQELAWALALAPLAAWLQLFSKMGDIFPMVASEAELEGESLLYRPALRTLGTAGVIGVSVMAVLSGWSSVVSPTSSISRLLAPVAESDLRAAERSVLYTLQEAPLGAAPWHYAIRRAMRRAIHHAMRHAMHHAMRRAIHYPCCVHCRSCCGSGRR